ncbi:MAG: hypothetical protein HXX15_10710 [Rhodopseudomonas sp.]|uniref:hypothetical protein n=1 Tax=Rhodopseudomonas sp. TaxID=1078 RepID=UPI0017DE82F8|nr:hypothetical protein [Rhodopseudomonas sp.]NVN86546.1 hypothetical protein [Rhodopseudomonas sp.]
MSNTDLQSWLRLDLFCRMHVVMRSMLGISLPHSRNASPVHSLCWSAVKAWLAVAAAVSETATSAIVNPNRRGVEQVLARGDWPERFLVMSTSECIAVDGHTLLAPIASDCDGDHIDYEPRRSGDHRSSRPTGSEDLRKTNLRTLHRKRKVNFTAQTAHSCHDLRPS